MGYKTTSASRTQAKSVVSSSIAAFNNPDGSGFGISSTNLTGKQVKQFSVTPGSASDTATSLAGGGVTITSLEYTTDGTFTTSSDLQSASVGSNAYIRITGSGFNSGIGVYVQNVAVTNTFVNSTEVHVTLPSSFFELDGLYPIYVFNTDGTGAIGVSDNAKVNVFTLFAADVEYLIVGGGGGGGGQEGGGGGGAGGFISSSVSKNGETTWNIVIGGGGSGGAADTQGFQWF